MLLTSRTDAKELELWIRTRKRKVLNLCQWLLWPFQHSSLILLLAFLSLYLVFRIGFTIGWTIGRTRRPLQRNHCLLHWTWHPVYEREKQTLDVIRDNFLSDWDNLHYGDTKTLWKWYHWLSCIKDVLTLATLVIMVNLPQFSCGCYSTNNELHWERVINTFLFTEKQLPYLQYRT